MSLGPLGDFIDGHRDAIAERWMQKVRVLLTDEASLTDHDLIDTLHLFLDEVVSSLRTGTGRPLSEARSEVAREHGHQRQKLHDSLHSVIAEYGLLLDAIAEVAAESGVELPRDDLIALGKCLITGAAEAAREFAAQATRERDRLSDEHLAFVAHELRNPLSSARMAWEVIRRAPALPARPAVILERSLARVADLIDRALIDVKLRHPRGGIARDELALAELLADVEEDARMEAEERRVRLHVERGDAVIAGDRRMLLSALTNVVRNAVKFTREGGRVEVRLRSDGDHVLVEVEDECGGLPPERAERLFEAFHQAGKNRSGFGLGLAIAKQALDAHAATISVKNVPDRGCVFTISLPATPRPDR